jgi:ribosomal protein S18 acetylase RimI-like enzyme
MNITELNPEEKSALNAFKDTEYPTVHKAHYGNDASEWRDEVFTLLAKEENEIAGFIRINVRMDVAYMELLLIGEKFRKQGIGQKLVQEAEAKSKEMGVHKIWLETGTTWSTKEFYEKLGYSVRATLPNDIGHQECLLMDKML